MNNYYDVLGINEVDINNYPNKIYKKSNIMQSENYEEINNYYNNGILNNEKKDIYEASEGFLRGNMFKNLYSPYKGEKIKPIIPKNDKERIMLIIYQTGFAMVDFHLYLDMYPTDSNIIRLYNQYRNQYVAAIKEYESKYGSITLDSDELNKTPWNWLKTKWPWEGDN